MTFRTSAALVALCVGLLQGCTQEMAAQGGARSTVYSTDLAGKAEVCTVPAVTLAAGKTEQVAMVTGGRGWCGVTVQDGGSPYAAGLVERRPEHGTVFVHTVGDDTRIDYTPAGAVTADSFTVKLLPGDAIVSVSVKAPAAGTAK